MSLSAIFTFPGESKNFTGPAFGKKIHLVGYQVKFIFSQVRDEFHLVAYKVKIFTESRSSKSFTLSTKSKNSSKWDFYLRRIEVKIFTSMF